MAPTDVSPLQYLGFELGKFPALLWLSEEAIDAPVPSEYTAHIDQSENVFFFNMLSQKSSYEHPLDASYRQLYSVLAQYSGTLAQPVGSNRGSFLTRGSFNQ